MYVYVASVNVVMPVCTSSVYMIQYIYFAMSVCTSIIYIRDVVYLGISLIYINIINVVSACVSLVYKWCCVYMCFFRM